MPQVFTENYFERGLRMDPHSCSWVVHIDDISADWVHANVMHPYKSSYILRVLNSLLFLRLLSISDRERLIAAYEQTLMLQRVSNLSISTMDEDIPLGESSQQQQQQHEEQLSDQPHLYTSRMSLSEIWRQKQTQCLIHGDSTNIDEDMWRLYGLYEELFEYESKLKDRYTQEWRIHGCVRESFPHSRPQLQLMLKCGDRYLRTKAGIAPFDQYGDIPKGQKAPPSPILGSLDPSQCSSAQMRIQSEESVAMAAARSVDEACQQWAERVTREGSHGATMNDQTTPSVMSTVSQPEQEASTYSILDLPDIKALSIQE
ncbi:hypothetical protein EDD11_002774 [Mortierella claussenii]|nr:hypothetical protein EDD11_002774 [Mortierella claussenii]